MKKNSKWVPRIADLLRLATRLTYALRTISLEAKSSAENCASSLFSIGTLIEEYHSNGDEYGIILDMFASVSRKPITKSLISSRSALEWIIDYSWWLLHIIGDDWKIYLYNGPERNTEVLAKLVERWDDFLKMATRDIAGWDEKNAPMYIRRKFPSFHEIIQLETEMNWEWSHLIAKESFSSSGNVFRSVGSDRRQPNMGGRTPLDTANPLKASLYRRILQLIKTHRKQQHLLEAISQDKDLKELSRELGLIIGPELIQAAKSWDRRSASVKTKLAQP